MAGGLVFLGGGASYFTASPVIGYESIGQDVGAVSPTSPCYAWKKIQSQLIRDSLLQGSLLFNSGGDLVWNWSPVVSAFGSYASCAVGEYFYLGGALSQSYDTHVACKNATVAQKIATGEPRCDRHAASPCVRTANRCCVMCCRWQHGHHRQSVHHLRRHGLLHR
jgi:hypothetical protein